MTWADPTGELPIGAGHSGYNPQTDKSGGDPCAKASSCGKTVREERTGKTVRVRHNYTERAVRFFSDPKNSYADINVDRTYKGHGERAAATARGDEKLRERKRAEEDANEGWLTWEKVESYAGFAATGLALLTPICPVCGIAGAGISAGLAVVDLAQGDGAGAAVNLVSAATFGAGGMLMRGSRLTMSAGKSVWTTRKAARAAGRPHLGVRDATASFRRHERASVSLRRASQYVDQVAFHPHGAFAAAHMTATLTVSSPALRE